MSFGPGSAKLKSEIVALLLRKGGARVGASQVSAAGTALLLLDGVNLAVLDAAYDSLRAGRLEIDAELISELYRLCPGHLKVELASSHLVPQLAPRFFEPIFDDAYRRPMSVAQRAELSFGLHSYLSHHLDRIQKYRKVILNLMHHPHRQVAMHGLLLAGIIGDLRRKDLELIERRLTSRAFYFRMNALNAVSHLLRRPHALSSEVLAFCTSDEVLSKTRRLYRADPDEHVRLCAKFVLRAHRELPRVIRQPASKSDVAPWAPSRGRRPHPNSD